VSVKPNNVPYRSLKVHANDKSTAPVKPEKRLQFSDLLRQRNTSASGARAGGTKPQNQSADQSLLPLLDDDEDHTADLLSAEDSLMLEESTEEPPFTLPTEKEEPEVSTLEEVAPLEIEPALVDRAHEVIPLTPDDPRELNIAQYLAQTVSRFCNNQAVGGEEGWQVQITLRPDVLNLTTMHLSLTPHWLQIRFDIHDTQARGLVIRHQKSLETMLDSTVVPRREVSITFE
jgi:hypothetical protein